MGVNYTPLSGLPVPDKSGTDDVPYWLTQLTTVMDSRLVLTAITTADRDSRYFNAPSGVICVVRASTTPFTVSGIYVKTSDVGTSVWSPIWTATSAPVPQNIQMADGIQAANGKTPMAVYHAVTNSWRLFGNFAFQNGTGIPTGTTLGTLPAAVSLSTVQPYYDGVAATSAGGTGGTAPSGAAKITINSSGSIVVVLPSGVAPSWVGIDLISLPGA